MKENITYRIASDNLFADIGLPDAEVLHAKLLLTLEVNMLIKRRKLSQVDTAKLLNIDQSKMSALNLGKISRFSLDDFFRFLNILDQDITIEVTPKSKSKQKADLVVKVPKTRKSVAIKRPVVESGSAAVQVRKK